VSLFPGEVRATSKNSSRTASFTTGGVDPSSLPSIADSKWSASHTTLRRSQRFCSSSMVEPAALLDFANRNLIVRSDSILWFR
jgi:hypothetical protein